MWGRPPSPGRWAGQGQARRAAPDAGARRSPERPRNRVPAASYAPQAAARGPAAGRARSAGPEPEAQNAARAPAGRSGRPAPGRGRRRAPARAAGGPPEARRAGARAARPAQDAACREAAAARRRVRARPAEDVEPLGQRDVPARPDVRPQAGPAFRADRRAPDDRALPAALRVAAPVAARVPCLCRLARAPGRVAFPSRYRLDQPGTGQGPAEPFRPATSVSYASDPFLVATCGHQGLAALNPR